MQTLNEVDYFNDKRGNIKVNTLSSQHFVIFYGSTSPETVNNNKLQELLKKLEMAFNLYVNDLKCPYTSKNKIAVYLFSTGLIQPPEPGPGVGAYGGNGMIAINPKLDWCTFKDSFHELAHVFQMSGGKYEPRLCESYATFAANYVLNKLAMPEDYGVDNILRFSMIHSHSNFAIDSAWISPDTNTTMRKIGYGPYQAWHLHQYLYKIYGIDFIANLLKIHRNNKDIKFFDIICKLLNMSSADFLAKYVSDFLTLKCCTIKNIKWKFFFNTPAPAFEWLGYQCVDITNNINNKKNAIILCNCSPFPDDWRIVVITLCNDQYSSVIHSNGKTSIVINSIQPTNKYWISFIAGSRHDLSTPNIYYKIV